MNSKKLIKGGHTSHFSLHTSQRGITLIALVITIIVLLILAGVTISMVLGDDGIISQAQEAKEKTEATNREEQVKLAVLAAVTEGRGTVKSLTELNDALEKQGITEDATGDANGYTLTFVDGTKYGITSSGKITEKTFTHTDKDNDGVLDVGELVTHKSGEEFYVIKAEANENTVILLAKYNLKKDANNKIILEQDKTGGQNTVAFSSTNYWFDSTTDSVIEYDLNKCPIPEVEDGETPITSIVKDAKDYGTKFGAYGRLMKGGEVDALGGNYGNGSSAGCPDFINAQSFWLNETGDADFIFAVHGTDSSVYYDSWYFDNYFGVRPVIEISKSLI